MTLAPKIDLYNLQYEITQHELQNLYKLAIDNGYRAIGVLPNFVPMLKDITMKRLPIISIVGLPDGKGDFDYWFKQAVQAIEDGADEIEWVLNYGDFDSTDKLIQNLRELTFYCHCKGVWTRLIIEIGAAIPIEGIIKITKDAGFKGIMTSTGMIEQVATVENVTELKNKLPKNIEIKASGKIYNRSWAEKLVEAGADLIATSRVI
jgi:deoxyribose-phosphate aldolase